MNVNIGWLIVLFILVVVSIFAIIGNIFLTKVVFQKGEKVGGLRCFDVSKTDAFFMRACVIIFWILMPLQIYTLIKFTCYRENDNFKLNFKNCSGAWFRYILVTVLVLEMVGLVALTIFAFKLKKRGDRYCAVLSQTDHNIAKVSVFVLWISNLYYGFQAMKTIFDYYRGEPKTKEEKEKAEKESKRREEEAKKMKEESGEKARRKEEEIKVRAKEEKTEKERAEKEAKKKAENISDQEDIAKHNSKMIKEENEDLKDIINRQEEIIKKAKDTLKKKLGPKETEHAEEILTEFIEARDENRESLRRNKQSEKENKRAEEKLKKDIIVKDLTSYKKKKITRSPIKEGIKKLERLEHPFKKRHFTEVSEEEEVTSPKRARLWKAAAAGFGKRKRKSRKRRMRRYL